VPPLGSSHRQVDWASISTTGPATPTPSMRTRSVSTVPPSSRRCAAGRRDARYVLIRSDSTPC
jgi:hypothetical protein